MSDILIPPVPHFVCRYQDLEDTVTRFREEREAERAAQQAEREAEQVAREAERAAQQAEREAEQVAREAERAAQQAEREAEQVAREAREVQQEAERETENRRKATFKGVIYSRFSRSFTARGYLLGNPPGYKANKL